MDRMALRLWLETRADISFARSSGPGGQNVNKLNTKSVIRVPLREIPGLSGGERAWLAARLAPRLAAGDVLIVQAQDERSQSMNRQLAISRAVALIEKGLHRPAPRRATKPSRAAKERRLQEKRLSSLRKRARARIEDD
jgi:ribosome-associated protein